MASEEKTSIRNELFIIVLAVVSAIILIIDLAAELSPEDREFLGRVDFVIALLFLTEFTVRLVRSPDRKTFLKKYWWELLASIPITNELTQSLRGLRLLRVVRLMRILRVVRLAVRLRILAERSERFAGKTHIIAITTTAGLVVLTGSLLFHFFESGTNQNVKSLWDSFWWAMVTVSTVGYGDIYPVTTGGRLTAMVMMVIGVGVLGSYVATITNYVVRTKSTSIE
jgi:voltage-gated potassium channel